jgi:hypothetical protein
VNVLVSLWTEDDSVFIHEVMRDQITFLFLAYCFSGARIGASLHNGKTEVKGRDGQVDRRVFEGLTCKGKTVPFTAETLDSGGLTTSQENLSGEILL